MDAPPSRAGSRFGPYELRSLLGRGGMGEVYEAYDTGKDRVVALKLLPSELAEDPSYQERFRRESQAAARLAEPHIIPIHDWGEIDGVLYIDMRLVRGQDLRSLLNQFDTLPPARVVGILEQVAAALDAAHYSGLVHRDVKPANILVTEADFAYLADFGIARTEGDSTVTTATSAVGSYAYMAPERFDVGPVTGRADIYSLGCVLHEALTGTRPFPVQNMSELVRAHLSQSPPAASHLRPGIPPGLDAVIARAMAKNPADRFYTAGEFAAAARNALIGGPVAVPPPPAVPPARTVPPPTVPPAVPPTAVQPRVGASDPTVVRRTPPGSAGSGPAYTTGTFPPASEEQPATGDLPVIVPADPTVVRPSDFYFTPLPEQARPAEPRWGEHSYASGNADFPYAPAPDPSAYPTSEHPVVEPPPTEPRPRQRRSIVVPVAVGVLAVALTAVAGVLGWQAIDDGGTESPNVPAAQDNPTRPRTAPPTPGRTTTAPTTTTTPTTVQLPAGATPCPSVFGSLGGYTSSATGTSVTSCPFAEEVRRAYADAAGDTPGTTATVVAVSPVTGRSYPMSCTAAGKLVTCTGGENAVVYVY
ncbi:serine/threonine-protein kinase [Nocardia otitidiscaviarum]|uniref:serine/threonine-protein kinase n=1 Tax=Nocardia otitidiscaviarum TaxID=1823 RepID=UPI001FD53F05|nr:serine/threonine-protein kinase [Nocardia otitidiscaviarum]